MVLDANYKEVANKIVTSCGITDVLCLSFCHTPIPRMLNAFGLLVKEQIINYEDLYRLNFNSNSYNTVVFIYYFDTLNEKYLKDIFFEVLKITQKNFFIILYSSQPEMKLRSEVERIAFEVGYRKNAAYYLVNEYESLNYNSETTLIPLEKLPDYSRLNFPLSILSEEKDLHMDMTRVTGERSDAHIARYHLAISSINKGDRVLDAACGLGYGSYVVSQLTMCDSVLGLDGSEYAINYANSAFAESDRKLSYKVGFLPDILDLFEDNSFEVVISFETLEHVENPDKLIKQFYRLLVPGGRLIVSVPNDWSDETGKDPNPFHLHVYDFSRLKNELEQHFLINKFYGQTASRRKIASKGGEWESSLRILEEFDPASGITIDCEWWLATCIKPFCVTDALYFERVISNVAISNHPTMAYLNDFINPWLMHSLVNISTRVKNTKLLIQFSNQVLTKFPVNSFDYAASLCVLAYQAVENYFDNLRYIEEIIFKIDICLESLPQSLSGLRWRVSLIFVKAKLFQSIGNMELSKKAYIECADQNAHLYSPHLITKVTEALYRAGVIEASFGNLEDAKICWKRGINIGKTLLSFDLEEVLINSNFPNLYNYGDGIREYILAWDFIARCANGVHLATIGKVVDFKKLNGSFEFEKEVLLNDLVLARKEVVEKDKNSRDSERILIERTQIAEKLLSDLNETRTLLNERTQMAEKLLSDLNETRTLLNERTQMAEKLLSDLNQTRSLLNESSQRKFPKKLTNLVTKLKQMLF